MRRRDLVVFALVAVLGSVMYVSADAVAKPERGVIVGTAVELSTLAMQGTGEGSAEAMLARCEQGFPIGIVEDETGSVWVCVYRDNAPASGLQTANKAMKEFMGKKVAAQGLKYEAKGIKVLRLSVISEY